MFRCLLTEYNYYSISKSPESCLCVRCLFVFCFRQMTKRSETCCHLRSSFQHVFFISQTYMTSVVTSYTCEDTNMLFYVCCSCLYLLLRFSDTMRWTMVGTLRNPFTVSSITAETIHAFPCQAGSLHWSLMSWKENI